MSGMDDKTPNAYEEAWDGLTQTGTDSVINGYSGNDLIECIRYWWCTSYRSINANRHSSYRWKLQ